MESNVMSITWVHLVCLTSRKDVTFVKLNYIEYRNKYDIGWDKIAHVYTFSYNFDWLNFVFFTKYIY